MEVSQLIELMNAVSEAGLTDFCYEENGVSVKIKKHPEKKIVASAPVEMIAPAAVAAPLQVCADTSVSADTDVSEEVTGNIVKSPLVGTFSGCCTICTSGRYGKKRSGTWHRGSNETDE